MKNSWTIVLTKSLMQIIPKFDNSEDIQQTINYITSYNIEKPRNHHIIAMGPNTQKKIICYWLRDVSINEVDYVLGSKEL